MEDRTTVDEIKARLPIVEFIQSYVPLKKAGLNYKGLCPFHQEKTPSFTVNPERQSWHCFGCGESGDIFSFVEKIEHVSFREALELLAGRVGIDLKPPTPAERAQKSEKALFYELYDLASRFYEKLLSDHPVGERARQYLTERGIANQSAKKWRLGFAPDRWDALLTALTKRGYTPDQLVSAGLVVKNEQGKRYDRFRNRLLFPIMNPSGRVVAFSGRALSPDQIPKYLNSPESVLYKKGQMVMGLSLAKEAIRRRGEVIVVEGNVDVLSCHQAGFENTVATGGTALTAEHIALLGRYTEHLLFAFDADEAGQKAAYKAAELALEAGLTPRFLALPPGEDPDSIIRKNPEVWRQGIAEAEPATPYFLEQAVNRFGLQTAVAKKEIGRFLLPLLRLLSDPIERADSLRLVSDRLRVPVEALEASLGKKPVNQTTVTTEITEPEVRRLTPSQWLLGLLVLHNLPIPNLPEPLQQSSDKTVRYLFELQTSGVGSTKPWTAWLAEQPEAVERRLTKLVATTTDMYADYSSAEIADEIELLVRTLTRRTKEHVQRDVHFQIQSAERSGDRQTVKRLLQELIASSGSSE